MARSKQATPIRRETSSEYFSRHDAAREKSALAARARPTENGGALPGTIATDLAVDKKDAGPMQLIVAVGGIYASL